MVPRGRVGGVYDLPYFKERDYPVVLEFMRAHPFIMLIGASAGRPVATQVPCLLGEREDGRLFLRGHMMRRTDHHVALLENDEVLCVFTGADTYVSASWYSNPQTGSTWNYMSVHARGRIRFLVEAELRAILEELTALFENDPNSPALFRHLPETYVSSLVNAIVGFELDVEELENVFKLSQNRDEPSYERIMRELAARGGDAAEIAEEMRKRKAQLFPAQSKS